MFVGLHNVDAEGPGQYTLEIEVRDATVPEVRTVEARIAPTDIAVRLSARDEMPELKYWEATFLDAARRPLRFRRMTLPVIWSDRETWFFDDRPSRGSDGRMTYPTSSRGEKTTTFYPSDLGRAAFVRIVVVDRFGIRSEPTTIQLDEATVVGPDEACSFRRVCPSGYLCSETTSTCRSDGDIASCDDPEPIAVTPDVRVRTMGEIRGFLPSGVTGSCGLTEIVAEKVFTVTVPEGDFDLDVSTYTPANLRALADGRLDDLIVYLQAVCNDPSTELPVSPSADPFMTTSCAEEMYIPGEVFPIDLGSFRVPEIPAGTYTLVVETTTLEDVFFEVDVMLRSR